VVIIFPRPYFILSAVKVHRLKVVFGVVLGVVSFTTNIDQNPPGFPAWLTKSWQGTHTLPAFY
jgi:hypothetical protein